MTDLTIGTTADGAPVALPLDALTQAFAIVGRRGSGKTNTAVVMVEEFVAHGLPLVILDPLGVWWGLRSGADGESAGLPVTILGGAHGDLPLEQTAGVLVAELIVEHPGAYLIDLSGFESRNAERRFAADFAERLHRLKNTHREALCLVVDEADTFAPQRTADGDQRVLGAFEAIARRGRSRGLGFVAISQRPAVLNKNVMTQIECLIALQVTSPQDREALKAWAQGFADKGEVEAFLASLAGLSVGEAWLWSPAWLQTFERIQVRARRTFDSSATPKAGETKVEPRVLAPVDLEALRTRMAATIEKAESQDPKKLWALVKSLQAEVLRLKRELPICGHEELIESLQSDLERYAGQLAAMRMKVAEFLGGMKVTIDTILEGTLAEVPNAEAEGQPHTRQSQRPDGTGGDRAVFGGVRPPRPQQESPLRGRETGTRTTTVAAQAPGLEGQTLTGPERRILDAIAWLEALGIDEPEQPAVAFLAGYTYGGGAFNNPRGRLRQRGFVEYAGDRIRLTDEGRALASVPDAHPTNEELQRRVMGRLDGPMRRLLQPLIDAYPHGLTDEALAAAAGYTPGAGAFNNPKGRLRSLGLIEYPQPRCAIARPLLFPEGN